MKDEPAPLLGAALTHLRISARWTQKRLADVLGRRRQYVNAIETGRQALNRQGLLDLAHAMGRSDTDVTLAILFADALSATPALEQPAASPDEPSPADSHLASRAALQWGLGEAIEKRARLLEWMRERHIEKARLQAAASWTHLKSLSAAARMAIIEREPRNWALALTICEASIHAARNVPKESLELATLACRIADTAPGSAVWQGRLRAYCLAHLANSERVASDLIAADATFALAWRLWGPAPSNPPSDLLPEWRLHDLEGSLRKAQGLFSAALACLDRAFAMAPITARGHVLLNRQHSLEQSGDIAGALVALEAATPLLPLKEDPRLAFSLEINRLVLLCHLGRHAEAQKAYPGLHALALGLRNKLDLARVCWLAGRIAAGLGNPTDARQAFENVRKVFVAHRVGIDAAVVSLELAIIDLEEGRFVEVSRLARELVTVFSIQGIHRETMAALQLFFRAATSGSATPALARHIYNYLEAARRNPRLRFVAPA